MLPKLLSANRRRSPDSFAQLATPPLGWTILICLIGLLGLGCGDGEGDRPSKAVTDVFAKTPQDDAAELFAFDHVPTFSLTLPPERWVSLQANAMAEQYVEAQLAFEGQLVGTVGLRFKGNYSTLTSCIDGTGKLICPKLSMKIGFAQYDTNLRFFGLKHLNFNAYVYDSSKLHEPIAYSLFRDMGIFAPRAAWANVLVNGESYGLFGMVEQVDGRFSDARWPGNGNGNLYKEAWPRSDTAEYYESFLQNNQGQTDHHTMLALASALTKAQPAGPAVEARTLGEWMSLDYLQRYIAVDEAMLNIDGFTSIYTSPEQGWTSNHNYYFYEEEKQPVLWLVPWDLDNTFWLNNGKSSVPFWTEIPADCSVVYPVFNGIAEVMAPGCDPLFQAISANRVAFAHVVDRLLAGPYEAQRITAKVDELAALVEISVAADPKLDPTTKVEWFRSSVAEIKRNVSVLSTRLRAISDGTPIHPLLLAATGVSDFESTKTIDALLSVQAYANPQTSATASIRGDAKVGHSLSLDFVYRDEIETWKQYAVFHVPIAGAPVDFGKVRGLRLRARASRPGTGRVELVSAAREAIRNYQYEGWRIDFATTWGDYQFLFTDVILPTWATQADELPLEQVLAGLIQLRVWPECAGRDSSGQLGMDASGVPKVDEGYVELDDVEFLP